MRIDKEKKSAENRHEEFHEGMNEDEFYSLFPDEKKKDKKWKILKRVVKLVGALVFILVAGALSFDIEDSSFILFLIGGFFIALILVIEDML